MAGIYRSKLFRLFAVATLMTVLQGPSAQAQDCDSTRTQTCCSTYSQCPAGYYKVPQCDTFSTPVPTTEIPDDDDSFNSTDSSNDTSTDATTEMTFNTSDSEGTSTLSTSTPTVYCRKCTDSCYNCSAAGCFTCVKSFSLKNGQCVSSNASEPFPVAAVVGGAVGGVVLIVVVVVVIVCVCRRKPADPAQSALERNADDMSNTQASSSDAESGMSEREDKNPDYENMGTKMIDMSTKIQQGQDKVLRYTRDPTIQNKVAVPIEMESTYSNQATINLNRMNQEAREIQQLPAAPAVPQGAQASNKQKKKKSRKAKVEEVAQDEPTPEAEPEDIYVNTKAVVGGSWEQEDEQVYENEASSPYVNLGFQN